VHNGGDHAEWDRIPLLAMKVRALLTGRLSHIKHGEQKVVMARGESWTTCPDEIVERFRFATGSEEFSKIELDMRGTWGWVYRESDIPNRHSHCNSNPNPALCGSFEGFGKGHGNRS